MIKIEMFFANGTKIIFECKTETEFNTYLELAETLAIKDKNNTASICYVS